MVRTSNLRKRRGERLDDWEGQRKRIRNGPNHRPVKETLNAIRASYSEDAEVSISTTKIPLVCPITSRRISDAARGSNCTHFQCFDLGGFLRMQSATPNWDCPILSCRKEISLTTIIIDDYFNEILQRADDAVKMVELLKDGSWLPVEDERPSVASKRLHSVAPGDDDEVQILGDTATRDGSSEMRSASVPVSVLYELHSKLSSAFQELNSLGYKRLNGVANSLVDMNAYIKEQIAQAHENSRLSQPIDACLVPSDTSTEQLPTGSRDAEGLQHEDCVKATQAVTAALEADVSGIPNGLPMHSSGDDDKPEAICDSSRSLCDITHVEDSLPPVSCSPPASFAATSANAATPPTFSPHTGQEWQQLVLKSPRPNERFVFAGEVNEKKKRLTKIIRAIGNYDLTSLGECLAILNAAEADKRLVLISYAVREAERWKKQALFHELSKLLPVTNGVLQQNVLHALKIGRVPSQVYQRKALDNTINEYTAKGAADGSRLKPETKRLLELQRDMGKVRLLSEMVKERQKITKEQLPQFADTPSKIERHSVPRYKSCGPWAEQTSLSGKRYYYNKETELERSYNVGPDNSASTNVKFGPGSTTTAAQWNETANGGQNRHHRDSSVVLEQDCTFGDPK